MTAAREKIIRAVAEGERGSENGSLMLAGGTDRQVLADNTDYPPPLRAGTEGG